MPRGRKIGIWWCNKRRVAGELARIAGPDFSPFPVPPIPISPFLLPFLGKRVSSTRARPLNYILQIRHTRFGTLLGLPTSGKQHITYTVFASLANILPKFNGRPLPASPPKSPHFTRKCCRYLGMNSDSIGIMDLFQKKPLSIQRNHLQSLK